MFTVNGVVPASEAYPLSLPKSQPWMAWMKVVTPDEPNNEFVLVRKGKVLPKEDTSPLYDSDSSDDECCDAAVGGLGGY